MTSQSQGGYKIVPIKIIINRDFQTPRNVRLRETPMVRSQHAGSQHRSHIRHPFHVDHASGAFGDASHPQTSPKTQSARPQHNPPTASMAPRPRPAHRPSETPAQARTRKLKPTMARAHRPRTSHRATPCPSRPRPRLHGPPCAPASSHARAKSSASAQCSRSRGPNSRHAATTHRP